MSQESVPVAGTDEAGRGRIGYKWLVLFVVSVGSFMGTMDGSIVNIALPDLTEVFDTTQAVVLWASLAYMLTFTGLMLSLGRLSDMLGRKRIYVVGFLIFTIGLGLCSISQSVEQLIAARVLQAVGGSMVVANGTAIVTAAFPGSERGRSLGLLGAVTGLGLMSGPALGGFLLDWIDWRAIFYLRLPIGLVGSLLAAWILKEQVAQGSRSRFDFAGAITLFGGLILFLLAVNQGQAQGWGSTFVLGVGSAGLFLLILFVFIELRTDHPVVDLGMFRHRVFGATNASLLFYFLSTRAVNFLLPFYMIQGIGFSSSTTGLVMATVPFMMFIMSPFSGTLYDRFGPQLLSITGLIVAGVGVVLLSQLGPDASAFDVAWRLVIQGFGSGLFITPSYSAVMGSVPPNRLSTASAMIATVRSVGQAASIAMGGAIFATQRAFHSLDLADQLQGKALSEMSLIYGVSDALLVSAALVGVGLLFVIMRGRSRSETALPV